MKKDNLYQEEATEEVSIEEESEEEEEDDDETINFDELEMSMNKSSISNIKVNIQRENEINNNIAINKKPYLDITTAENDISANKITNQNISNLLNTNQNTAGNIPQNNKIDDKIIITNNNPNNNQNNIANSIKNIDISIIF